MLSQIRHPRAGVRPRRRRSARKAVAMVLVALTSVFGVLIGDAPSAPSADAACTISSNLGLGSRGQAVQCLQSTLNALGYNSGPVDGSFGAVTYRAVQAFQRAKGLKVDGLVGRMTGSALGIWGAGTSAPPTTPAACMINAAVRLGSTGDSVSCLQRALNAAGYPVGRADGQFGNQTLTGVRNFQRAKGLLVDGVVGMQTAMALGIWGTPTTPSPTPTPTPTDRCAPPAGTPANARQVVVVTASGSRADVDLLMHDGTKWLCVRMDMTGRVGRNGVRTLAQRRSGDGTTPGGIFPLGSMTAGGQTFEFFGNGVNPGVLGTWHQVQAGDCWAATPNQPSYNTLVTRTATQCVSPDEYLVNFQGAYSRAAIIDANMGPNRSGDAVGEAPLAAAIFLHRTSYDAAGNSKPTSGCVSLGNANLVYVLQRLKPGEAYFVIR